MNRVRMLSLSRPARMNRDPRLIPLVAALCLLCGIVNRAQTNQAPTPAPVLQDFPEGPNREVAVRLCRDCHPVTEITRHRESRSRWSAIVDQMSGEGANISN